MSERRLPERMEDLIYNFEISEREETANWFRRYGSEKYFTNPLDVPEPKLQEISENTVNDMFQLVKTHCGDEVYHRAKIGKVRPSELYVLQTLSFEDKMGSIKKVTESFDTPSLILNGTLVSIYMPPIVEIWDKKKVKDKVDEGIFKAMPEEVYVLIDGVHRTKHHYERGNEEMTVVFAYQKNGGLPAKIFGKIDDVEQVSKYVPTGKTVDGRTKFIDLDESKFRKYNELGFGKFDRSKNH